jgi:hypothetical protein
MTAPEVERRGPIAMQNTNGVVVGLGGYGASTVEKLRSSNPSAASYLTLDHDSPPFKLVFEGSLVDVIPPIWNWSRSEDAPANIRSWLNELPNKATMPLRDLPDLFLRNTTRPFMRAAWLMHFKSRIAPYLLQEIDDPGVVVLVTRAIGSTGSAWIADLAQLFSTEYPRAQLHLVLIDHDEDDFGSALDVIKTEANKFWVLREILADSSLSQSTHIATSIAETDKVILKILEGPTPSTGIALRVDASDHLDKIGNRLRDSSRSDFQSLNRQLANARCRPISDLLNDDALAALVGLLAISSEGSSVLNKNFSRSQTVDSLKNIALPDDPQVPLVVRLALSHPSLGTEEQVLAYRNLIDEGRHALNNPSQRTRRDNHRRLLESRTKIRERLMVSSSTSNGGVSDALICDLYPVLLSLIDQIIKA